MYISQTLIDTFFDDSGYNVDGALSENELLNLWQVHQSTQGANAVPIAIYLVVEWYTGTGHPTGVWSSAGATVPRMCLGLHAADTALYPAAATGVVAPGAAILKANNFADRWWHFAMKCRLDHKNNNGGGRVVLYMAEDDGAPAKVFDYSGRVGYPMAAPDGNSLYPPGTGIAKAAPSYGLYYAASQRDGLDTAVDAVAIRMHTGDNCWSDTGYEATDEELIDAVRYQQARHQ
jgi:hypothetical protein